MDTVSDITKYALRLGCYLDREGSRVLRESGLNQQQFVVLKHIEKKGYLFQKDICNDLLFEKSNVSKIVHKLATLGLITINADAADARLTKLEITTLGRRIAEQYMSKLNEWNEKWLSKLSEAERMVALHGLKLLVRK